MRILCFRAGPAALAVVLLAASLAAQDRSGEPVPKVAPSGRVTTSVTFDGRVLPDGGWFTYTPSHSGPSRITIDYGQPHARGREVFGALVPYGEVWRLGANWATRPDPRLRRPLRAARRAARRVHAVHAPAQERRASSSSAARPGSGERTTTRHGTSGGRPSAAARSRRPSTALPSRWSRTCRRRKEPFLPGCSASPGAKRSTSPTGECSGRR